MILFFLLEVLMVLSATISIAIVMGLSQKAKEGSSPRASRYHSPRGVYGRVAPRSGLAVKYGIQVGAGVIDPDYTGEISVVIFNMGDADFEVKKGDRVAQLVLEKCETPPVEEIGLLQETLRGDSGFGSTGN
jgi:dUTP pyrophosphatase